MENITAAARLLCLRSKFIVFEPLISKDSQIFPFKYSSQHCSVFLKFAVPLKGKRYITIENLLQSTQRTQFLYHMNNREDCFPSRFLEDLAPATFHRYAKLVPPFNSTGGG